MSVFGEEIARQTVDHPALAGLTFIKHGLDLSSEDQPKTKLLSTNAFDDPPRGGASI